MNHLYSYKDAYQALHKITPLRFDCGRLCERACCRGLEADAGMWLFPREEAIAAQEGSFTIQPLERNLPGGRPLYQMTCAGECRREFRPLACRIFPLVPLLMKNGVLRIGLDPRAFRLCPIAAGRSRLQMDFRRAVGRICRELSRDPEIVAFYRLLADEIAEYQQVMRMFGRDKG